MKPRTILSRAATTTVDVGLAVIRSGEDASQRNSLISPLGVVSSLAACRAGAGGETAAEIDDALGLDEVLGVEFLGAVSAYLEWSRSRSAGLSRRATASCDARSANALWVDDSISLRQDFRDRFEAAGRAEVHQGDFSPKDWKSVERAINAWCREQTNGRIREAIPAGSAAPRRSLILLNASYFAAAWQFPFDEEATREGEFSAPGGTLKIPFMSRDSEDFKYSGDDKLEALELPYKGRRGGYALVILLPRKSSSLEELLADLSGSRLQSILSGMERTLLCPQIPKFEIETRNDLTHPLGKMGITQVFQPGTADFSRIAGDSSLYLSAMSQSAYIRVDVKGTEAAAATVALIRGLPVYFVADRPFLYLLRDRETGLVHFMGVFAG